MKIDEIRLWQFRNYEQMQMKPAEGINLIFGQNGSGKTNILEAIHYCALGKSHRVNNDAFVIRNGQKAASVSLCFRQGEQKRQIDVRLNTQESQKKAILINQKKISRMSELMGCFKCVIFSPEDLELVRGGPSVRRRFLDMMISQFSKAYFTSLQQYKKAMEQRNALLKEMKLSQSTEQMLLDEFERVMAENGEVIIRERKKINRLLSNHAAASYEVISRERHEIFTTSYQCFADREEISADEIARKLYENRREDIRYGMSLVGPHHDDLVLNLNKKNMKQYASQGQVRSAALCLKLAQMKVLQEISTETPVLLLDDVMSELDKERRLSLLDEIAPYQTFITCTDESDLDGCKEKRSYSVFQQDEKACIQEKYAGPVQYTPVFQEPDFC